MNKATNQQQLMINKKKDNNEKKFFDSAVFIGRFIRVNFQHVLLA